MKPASFFAAPQIQAVIWMFFCCFCLTMIAALGRFAAHAGMHPAQTVFLRLLFALILILPFALRARLTFGKTQQLKTHMLRSAVGICAMWVWFLSISIVPITDQTALSFLAPIFTTLGAILFLKEIVRIRRWLAIIIGLSGAIVIVRPGFAELSVGHLYAVGSAMMMGMSMLLIKHLTAKDSPLMIVFFSHIFMTLLAFVPAMLVWSHFPPELYLYLMGFAPFAFFGHFALAKAYSLADASFVAALDYARLPFAALIGWLMFAEFSDIWTWIGASIIFASAFYIVRREVQLARSQGTGATGK
ncbi:MAG: DMT family transporter [Candidatus Puniceispirillaceae bacterium]